MCVCVGARACVDLLQPKRSTVMLFVGGGFVDDLLHTITLESRGNEIKASKRGEDWVGVCTRCS